MERGEHSNSLPPEPWMNQLPSGLLDCHPGSSVGCSTRDTSEQRAPFFSHGAGDSRFRENVHVPSAAMLQSFGRPSQAAHSARQIASSSASQSLSDRSAWTHLLSLDPSLANYNSQSSNQTPVTSYGHPLFEMGSMDRPVSDHHPAGHHLSLVNESLSLPSMNIALAQHSVPYNTTVSNDNFHQRSVAPLSHQTQIPQNLNQLINLSRDLGNFSTIPASTTNLSRDLGNFSTIPASTTNQPVDLLDRGGYSPVSPPSHDTNTSPSSSNIGHVSELLKRDAPSSANYSISSENNFGYMAEKHSGSYMKIPTSISLLSSDLSSTLPDPQSFPMAMDVPLDMTKVFTSKDEAQDMSLSKMNNHLSTTPVAGNVLVENSSSSFDKNAKEFMQPPEKPCIETIPSISLSTDKQSKPVVRSTPKKSNFYGRDASLFSFPSEPLSQSQTLPSPVVTNIIKQHHIDASSSIACVPLISVEKPLVVDSLHSSFSSTLDDVTSVHTTIPSDCDSGAPSFADSFIDASTRDCEPINNDSNVLRPDSFQLSDSPKPPPVVNQLSSDIDISKDTIPVKAEMPQCGIHLTAVEVVETQNDIEPVKAILDSSLNGKSSDGKGFTSMSDIAATVNQIGSVIPPVEQIELEIKEGLPNPDDAAITAVPPMVPVIGRTVGKRKKRKGAGKRGKNMKSAMLQSLRIDGFGFGGDIAALTQDTDSMIEDQSPLPIPVKKRKKKGAANEAEGEDPSDSAPRRSSSRKSKANAMRLIELQADSSYGYASQLVSEELSPLPVPIPTQGKKRATKPKKFAGTKNDNVDLSDDSISSGDTTLDEQDAEYAPDEEEDFQEDVSPLEVSNLKSRRVGGLKISIKLGTENLAQIVSGIRERPPTKKRKGTLKKLGKSKFKSQAFIDEEDEEERNGADQGKEITSGQDSVLANQPESLLAEASSTPTSEEKLVPDGKEKSLLDKYFSAANAVNKQSSIEKPVKKALQLKKKGPGRPPSLKPAKSNIKRDGTKGSSRKGKVVKKRKVSGENSAIKPENIDQNNGTKTESSVGDPLGDVPKFVCGYCPQKYHNKDELMSHMMAHMAEMESKVENNATGGKKPVTSVIPKKVKIQIAPEKFETKPSPGLNKTEKKKAPIHEHKCGDCGQIFPSQSTLLDHVSTHTEDKPFECNLCHKCFKERDLLSAHRKTHSEEGLVRCPICSKGFIHEPDLVNHIRTHPKRSTPLIPLKRKMPMPASQNSIKTQKMSAPVQEAEQPVAKPSSFASALSGQDEKALGKTLKSPTILLKRSEVSSSRQSFESSSKPLKNATVSVSQSQKSAKSSEAAGTIKTHSTNAGPDKSNDSKEDNKTDEKANSKPLITADDSDPGHCTCKECPECVTRFLQSFY